MWEEVICFQYALLSCPDTKLQSETCLLLVWLLRRILLRLAWLPRLALLRLLAWLALLHVGRELRVQAGGVERCAHGLDAVGRGLRLDGLLHIGIVVV